MKQLIQFLVNSEPCEIVVQTNVPAQFPLQHARGKYSPDQLFLCDRPRWQTTK